MTHAIAARSEEMQYRLEGDLACVYIILIPVQGRNQMTQGSRRDRGRVLLCKAFETEYGAPSVLEQSGIEQPIAERLDCIRRILQRRRLGQRGCP